MESTQIPLHERIFCNRSLNLESIKAVGFDMDYTLVLYKPYSFETLVYNYIKEKLVADGYPCEILNWEFNPSAMIRGLVIDKKRGNILKLDAHNYVKIAYHGSHMLSQKERHELYDGIVSIKEPNFAFLDSFFVLTEAFLINKLVDLKDAHHMLKNKTYEDFYLDVRRLLDIAHRDDNLKSMFANNPQEYILPDPHLMEILKTLRQMGKKIFLLTNSIWPYVNPLMTYLLGTQQSESWLDFFDFIVTHAQKPHFFSSQMPMINLDHPKVFEGGDVLTFHQMLNVSKGSEVLYVGDHIYGDILRSKKMIGWRTMLLINELENELKNEHHPIWGSLLKTGRHPSLFSAQMSRFACLYTKQFANLRHYFSDTNFEAKPSLLPHEC